MWNGYEGSGMKNKGTVLNFNTIYMYITCACIMGIVTNKFQIQ